MMRCRKAADMNERGNPLEVQEDPEEFYPPELLDVRRRAFAAIRVGDNSALRQILACHPEIAANVDLSNLMAKAVELGQAASVAALLEAGVTPNLFDGSGGTPLMAAASNGHLEVARLLLEAVADPNILVEDHCDDGDPEVIGLCALFFALTKGHRDLVKLLEPATLPEIRALAYRELPKHLEWMARNPPPHLPTMALFTAILDGRADRLSEAVAAGGDVNYQMNPEASHPKRGSTPLSSAAAAGRMDMIRMLLEAGADPSVASHDGRTPAEFAVLNGHPEAAEILRSTNSTP